MAVSDGNDWSDWHSISITTVDNTPPSIGIVGENSSLNYPTETRFKVKIENSEINFYQSIEIPNVFDEYEDTPFTGNYLEGVTYRFELQDENNKFTGYAEPRFLTVHSEGDSVDFSADGISYTQYIGTYPDDGITRSDSVSGVSGFLR